MITRVCGSTAGSEGCCVACCLNAGLGPPPGCRHRVHAALPTVGVKAEESLHGQQLGVHCVDGRPQLCTCLLVLCHLPRERVRWYDLTPGHWRQPWSDQP
jgi:hypothetical protein